MTYFSKKLNRVVSPKEILAYATKRDINYVKARCELRVEEQPTPQPKKSFRNISDKDLWLLTIYGTAILGLKY